ncbi:MAG TPA: hypothetical protein VGJ20_37940, partial [Xanthobacteraceae bacterium]
MHIFAGFKIEAWSGGPRKCCRDVDGNLHRDRLEMALRESRGATFLEIYQAKALSLSCKASGSDANHASSSP